MGLHDHATATATGPASMVRSRQIDIHATIFRTMTKKVLVVFGTRPEAIKMAPLIHELNSHATAFHTCVCVSAQHRLMLDQVLELFQIAPDYDLGIMSPNQDLFDITLRTLHKTKEILQNEQPDIVLTQGDTTTTFAASLAAFYCQVPVGHIEAGLRTYDKHHPFPEEVNRRITTVLADLHFAPTAAAKSNLVRERVPEDRIWVTGNTVVDALLQVLEMPGSHHEELSNFFKDRYNLNLAERHRKIILVTGHRRESFGSGFDNICRALKAIAEQRDDVILAYPVHLNPNVRQPVYSILAGLNNVILMDPLEYQPFVFLMKHSHLILTDSGGVQEEAPSIGKPVLVMRETTERPEGVEAGVVRLVGTHKETIVAETLRLLNDHTLYAGMADAKNPYGDGTASQRIVQILRERL